MVNDNGRATFSGRPSSVDFLYNYNKAILCVILSGFHGEYHGVSEFFLLCTDK